ncbi:MAG TPA: urea ABC transporter ATP-binding subunit UrtE [Methylomirabilota bacterium]|jgi:urea transport system ATP-binding protein|nr:urea ABC transporter ATP-binding subunit UrtE [Methylomirabilota bacterium]
MLEIQGLNVAYGESQVLWDVSLHVPAGNVVCLMGRNGVGKTTLLKTVMGLLPARSGRIVFDGADLGGRRPEERAAVGIGYVPQGREIFPNLTVRENLRMGLLGRRSGRRRGGDAGAHEDLDGTFDLFPRLKMLLGRKGGVLSGGEQQQLAIARVLLAGPKLLLMDEPTEGIQPSVILQIEEAIERIKARGIAVLLVEQYLEFAWRLAGSYAIMRKGTIVSRGATAELRHDMVREHLTV